MTQSEVSRASGSQTRDRVIRVLRDELQWQHLGDWSSREGNSNVEPELLGAWLKRRGLPAHDITTAIHLVFVEANDEKRALPERNRSVFRLLRDGVPIPARPGRAAHVVRVLDCDHPDQNDFAIADEVSLRGRQDGRLDIVLYVNGIAIAVVELKLSRESLATGIQQCLLQQCPEYHEWFFSTVQFVLAGNDSEGLQYAPTRTGERHWLRCRRDHANDRLSTVDDHFRKICEKSRFIGMMRDFVLFDAGSKHHTRALLASPGTYRPSNPAPVVLPADDLTISVERTGDVYLDGRRRRTNIVAGMQLFSVDLSRSTGFHNLRIGADEFWFGTEDAKLRLAGITAMLADLRERGLAWSGQLMFSDGSRLRDARVIYGWLDQYASTAIGLADAIGRQPRLGTIVRERLTSRAGGRVLRQATMKLVRSRGRDIVDADPHGVLHVGSTRYSPRKVMTARRTATLDTPANRAISWLVEAVRALSLEVAREAAAEERDRCRVWASQANRVAERFRRLRAQPPSATPSVDEIADRRYAEALRLARLLARMSQWSPDTNVQPSYAYVRYADEIFQAYVADVIAQALDLSPVERRTGAPAFSSEAWDLFCGTLPREHVMRSWLSYTNQPRDFLPDVVLHHKADGTVAVGDAKYRNDGAHVSSSSVKEVLAYMGAFDLPRALIFYPPDPPSGVGLRVMSAKGREFLEVGVAPVLELDLAVIREAIERARFTPSWHD